MPAWRKGQSGNPKGRPPRARALSLILARKADDKVGDLTNKEVVADLLWRFAVSGEVQLGESILKARDASDWLNAIKWIYAHLEGPAPTANPDDNELIIRVERIPE